MKKILTVLTALFIFSGFIFAQDYGSEAEDLAELETTKEAEVKNEYFVGFDVSILGIEPTFQMVRNEHMELQAGISFIQYGSDIIGLGNNKTAIITPIVDFGYRTNFYSSKSYFSIGATAATPLAIEKDCFTFSGALAIYLKLSKQMGIFELGGKTYVPVLTGYYSTFEGGTKAFEPSFANWMHILAGLAFTTFQVKIHI